ncbi:MAG: glycosyltransferase family 2 protein [Solirubrobacterales bacterium]
MATEAAPGAAPPLPCSYLVPVRWGDGAARGEMAAYLAALSPLCAETIVVDGSPAAVFAANHEAFAPCVTAHLPPDPDLACRNGKVAGVLTAARCAGEEALVIADDDVRYERTGLERVLGLLRTHDLVRPQNYFEPLPWHARWDTARTLLNRAVGRDFPGTLAVRRSLLTRLGGYDGDVLFENLELIRSVEAAGGSVASPLDLYVRRLPPSAAHFRGQRLRQAYDDFALPARQALWLAIAPLLGLAVARRRPGPPLLFAAASVALAELGRRRGGGARRFPASAAAMAPLWLLERGVCSWLAVAARLGRGGVRYAGSRIAVAANSKRELRRRLTASPPAARG